MPGLQIPMKTSSSGGAVAYDTAVDGSYSVYNAAIKNYPVANAFVDGSDTSQEKWGLQVTARTTQNNAWKTQLTYGAVTGSAALSVKSITYPFTRTISKLESGNIQSMIYQNGYSVINLDETNNKIGNSKIYGTTNIVPASYQTKGYVVTAGGNKYLVIQDGTNIKTYPGTVINGNFVLSSTTPAATVALTATVNATVRRYFMIAGYGANVWIGEMVAYHVNASAECRVTGYLYTIGSNGSITLTNTASNFINDVTASPGTTQYGGQACGGSYVKNTTAYCYVDISTYYSGGNAGKSTRAAFTVNLTNTSVFTQTSVRKETSGLQSSLPYGGYGNLTGELIVGYDGTNILFVDAAQNIFTATAGAFTDSGVNSIAAWNLYHKYRSSTTVLSTAASNVWMTTNGITVKNVAVGGSFTNLYNNNIFVYEMSGANEEDTAAAFRGIYLPTNAFGASSGTINLSANGTVISTKTLNHLSLAAADMSFVLSTASVINSTKILFSLDYQNLDLNDCKLGFGLSGGTYASPTGAYENSTINLLLN